MATSRFGSSAWWLGTLVSSGGKDAGILHVVMDDGAGTAAPGATAAKQDTQITAEQAIQATAGATTGAAVVTDANGTIQQYLRGIIVKMIAQFPASLGAKTSAASLSVTLASDMRGTIGGAWTDRSITSLAGASETLMAANTSRRNLLIHNEGATSVTVNLAGGTAVSGVGGNITLTAGQQIKIENNPPTSAITVIGTATGDVTAYEG